MMRASSHRVGVVVIGRNEGPRLRTALASARRESPACIYVDSGSADGSPELARGLGIDTWELDPGEPFSAARGRNEGFERLLALHPDLELVQFLDGDSELAPGWTAAAAPRFDADPALAVVCGELRERAPDASTFQRLCALEWTAPPGETTACGGNTMLRVAALRAAGGFRSDLVAGEEPELCLRLRRLGWRLERIAAPMASHDAGMSHVSEWWQRNLRAGRAYAHGAWLHGTGPERYCVREVLANWLWGLVLPCAVLAGTALASPAWLLALAVYPALYGRIAHAARARGFDPADARLYARWVLLAKLPQALGQCRFVLDLVTGRVGRRPGGRTPDPG
jgi:GT2 family glycosyltransferase